MDGPTLQRKVFLGYGKAATRIGFPCTVYRSSSMLAPIVPANIFASNLYASFTPTLNFQKYNKPHVPDWIGIVDATSLQIGDWLVGPSGTFYLADIQESLPLPFIQCVYQVSIVRPAYSTSGPTEELEVTIASNLPVFGFSMKSGVQRPSAFPSASETKAAIPGRLFYVNTRTIGAVQKDDVVIDEVSNRYIVDAAVFTSFGIICQTHIEKP